MLETNHCNHKDARDEMERMTLLQRCRKRAADEKRPLRQIFDEACRSSDAGTSISFASVESSMYKRRRTAMSTLPTDHESCDSTLSGSRFASVGESPFYRYQVTVGDNDTAVIFASDDQLELLGTASVVYVEATFRVVPYSYFTSCSRFLPLTRSTRFRFVSHL